MAMCPLVSYRKEYCGAIDCQGSDCNFFGDKDCLIRECMRAFITTQQIERKIDNDNKMDCDR